MKFEKEREGRAAYITKVENFRIVELPTENRLDSLAWCRSEGFTARKIDPVEELRVAYQDLTQIQKTIHAIRHCLKTRNYRQLDAELVDAWLNTQSNKSKR